MLLNDFRQINQLDTEIASLHQRLNDLYQKRSALAVPDKQALQSIAQHYNQTFSQADSAEALYQHLVTAWGKREVAVPTFRTLKARLQKVTAVQASLTSQYPELANQLEVVLVPPTAVLQELLNKDAAAAQQIILDGQLEASHKWRLYVVYAASHGLPLEHPSHKELSNRALGVNQYIALVAQEELLLDEQSWTVLLNQVEPHATTAPCVHFSNQSYRFMTDEIDSVFNDNTFRPAREVI